LYHFILFLCERCDCLVISGLFWRISFFSSCTLEVLDTQRFWRPTVSRARKAGKTLRRTRRSECDLFDGRRESKVFWARRFYLIARGYTAHPYRWRKNRRAVKRRRLRDWIAALASAQRTRDSLFSFFFVYHRAYVVKREVRQKKIANVWPTRKTLREIAMK